MLAAEMSKPDIALNFQVLRCPDLIPTIKKSIINKTNDAQAGQVLRAIASDLNAPSRISSWPRQCEHMLLDMIQEDEDFVFLIQRPPKSISLEVES